jgi:replicative DNA helicase
MTRSEIMMRLSERPRRRCRSTTSATATMTTRRLGALARKMGAGVREAPMFIDDSPNMTMMEIRAKARRLKQRHDLQPDRASTTCS